MGRVLRAIHARRGRAKPTAPCPRSTARRAKQMALIRGLIDALPADAACAWEDEADIDLDPRIGADWTLPGEQRTVPTPVAKVKRYFPATMDLRTDELLWVESERKSSRLFIELLKRLLTAYAGKHVIHVVPNSRT